MIIHFSWREGDDIGFECDLCGLTLKTDTTDFDKASKHLDEANWYTRKEGDKWHHYCSGCRRRKFGDPDAVRRAREQRKHERSEQHDHHYGDGPMTTHWMDVLELSPPVTKVEIRAARRRLSRKYHPDVDGGSVELMQKINAAADQGLREMRS